MFFREGKVTFLKQSYLLLRDYIEEKLVVDSISFYSHKNEPFQDRARMNFQFFLSCPGEQSSSRGRWCQEGSGSRFTSHCVGKWPSIFPRNECGPAGCQVRSEHRNGGRSSSKLDGTSPGREGTEGQTTSMCYVATDLDLSPRRSSTVSGSLTGVSCGR